MGSELQGKYQKLAQEYAKLRSQVDVLKKAFLDEQAQKKSVEENLRERMLSLRKHVQENESLEFRNQQLSRRVAFLQEDASTPTKSKKKKGGSDGFPPGVSDVQAQELAAKIAENERLHMKLLEITQKSERTISGMENKIKKLEQEVSNHVAGVDEVNREHELQLESMRTERAMLEAKLAKQKSELDSLKKAVERQQMVATEEQQNTSVSGGPQRVSLLDPITSSQYAALNVPVVDAKLQAEVLKVLPGSIELVTTFATQMSTFHSYLEQRCKAYPLDTATGHHMSVVNQKLCELLHSSSSFTKPLVSTLTLYHKKLESNPLVACSDLEDFASTHQKFVVYLETLTPYLQLSLQEECLESVCGPQLSERNLQLSQALPCLSGAFSSLNSYLSLIIGGPSGSVYPGNMAVCLGNLQLSLRDIQESLTDVSSHFSSKIAQEYQLPTASQKLNTTNECIVSSLTGLHTTVEQLCSFIEINSEVFGAALEQNLLAAENKSSVSSVVQRLRQRASGYIRRLQKECPESVPYTLAIYNAKCLSSSSESRDTLMKQVMANQEKLTRLEQEKEQLILDLQLLRVKYEKEQKRVSSLDAELAQLRGQPSAPLTPMSTQPSLNTSGSSIASNPPLQSKSESMGSLNTISDGIDGNEEEPSDDAVREELIRKHFASRIAELSGQLQEADSKAAHHYAECRALHKQLNHSTSLRSKYAQDLQIASENIQQLQDQLATTSSNYERQLSTMSDHLCELNDKLLKQSEEMEILRKSKGKRWGKRE